MSQQIKNMNEQAKKKINEQTNKKNKLANK
jgi:hypothetical protein